MRGRFGSCMSAWFERFVALKRAGGTAYQSQADILDRFDRFLAIRIQGRSEIGGVLLREYVASTKRLAPGTRQNLVSVVWPALAYAIRHGAPCEAIPEQPHFPHIHLRRPYIYSDDEIHRILVAALELGPAGSLRPLTYSTLFALLVTTGLRVGEAFQLNIGDVDFAGALLDVRQGKFHKARRVPLRESTVAGLARYQAARRSAGYESLPESPLFVNRKRRRLAHPGTQIAFRACLRATGIRDASGRYPRLHDLRHTFAVRRVVAWYREGIDVNQRLPALATYMGHVNINCTLHYLKPNESMLREAAKRFEVHCPIPAVYFVEVAR